MCTFHLLLFRLSLSASWSTPKQAQPSFVLCFRSSFAFSHSANRRNLQQPTEDIETGQVLPAEQRADDDCLPRNAGLTSASSAPLGLQRQNPHNTADSPTPASPSPLQTHGSALSAGAISPAASPGAQVSSAGVLGKLLSVGSRSMKRSPSGTQPVCLICLENLTPEDFEVIFQTLWQTCGFLHQAPE